MIDPWGDADDNETLQAFDAAKVLVHVLDALANPIDEQAANVDIDPVGSGITPTPFDASFILQKRVGLIATFPVQDPASSNHPQGTPSSAPKRSIERRLLTLVPGVGYISVVAEERSDIVAGEVVLAGIAGRVEMGAELNAFLQAARPTDEGLRVVFADPQSVSDLGELLRVYGVGPTAVELVRAAFNDGAVEGVVATGGLISSALPSTPVLHANMPNSFNPSTTIRFELPQLVDVRLDVYDLLGQKVRTLVAGERSAVGHEAVWDGRDGSGQLVGNGVYFYRLRAGDYVQMRRMMLFK